MPETPWIKQFPGQTREDIRASLRQILDRADLPTDLFISIFIKPNFNNDLNSLTGNSTDLRLIWDLCTELCSRGYNNITVGDGPNSGAFKAGLDVLGRLGMCRAGGLLGVECIDLNFCEFEHFMVSDTVGSYVAKPILESDYIISIPKIKTHADTVMSCCVKNWMGINVGEAKWKMHGALSENLVHNVSVRPPDLCIVDGIIGMEGNGPGDGDPVWIGAIIAGNDPFYIDCAIAKAIGLDPEKILYLREYVQNHKSDYIESPKQLDLPMLRPASERSLLTKIATSDWLEWLRILVRPLTKLPCVMQLLYRCGIVQDVYDPAEGSDQVFVSNDISDEFMDLWCPSNWAKIRSTASSNNDKIDVFTSEHCIRCGYCLWADMSGKVNGNTNSRYLKRHIKRFYDRVNNTLRSINVVSG